ncbi:MAG: AMP-binding protein [Actinomycetota bacterium]
MMAELVMLDLPAGPGFVEAMRRVWDDGDACFPLDQRLPPAEAARVRSVARPTAVIEADGERRALDDGEAVEDGDAILVATSGTTGLPKGVIHTHESVRASSVATSEGLDADPTTDHWLACLPPAHIGGLAVIMRSLHTGAGLTVLERFDPALADQAARDGATLVSVVTRALNQIDVDGFRAILIGGAAPPPNLPAHVIPTYGMTETGSGCVYAGYPLDGVEMRAAESGEIEIRADLLLRTYRTVDGHRDPYTADGWFPTGDLGRIEADGRLWIDGRAGDMIITGGENVWPSPVERAIGAHPAIKEVAVVGRQHPEWGQIVVACVTLSGDDAPTLDELREWVQRDLPVWSAPKDVLVFDELPKTALGKVRRTELLDDR